MRKTTRSDWTIISQSDVLRTKNKEVYKKKEKDYFCPDFIISLRMHGNLLFLCCHLHHPPFIYHFDIFSCCISLPTKSHISKCPTQLFSSVFYHFPILGTMQFPFLWKWILVLDTVTDILKVRLILGHFQFSCVLRFYRFGEKEEVRLVCWWQELFKHNLCFVFFYIQLYIIITIWVNSINFFLRYFWVILGIVRPNIAAVNKGEELDWNS